MDILQTAVVVAKKKNISTIAIASTTGKTAAKLLELVKTEKMTVIVVTHDEAGLHKKEGLMSISV